MPYNFGFPDVLVNIHFPHGNGGFSERESLPWYWYLSPVERPYYFQYIFDRRGWIRTQNFPIIKILPIDTQVLTPTPPFGHNSLEAAIDDTGNAFGPDSGWGRFEFTDDFFWKVMGQKKPEFTVVQGRPTQIVPKGVKDKRPPIAKVITQVVQKWKNNWNFGATAFNSNAAAAANGKGFDVDPSYPFPPTKFALPLPTSNNIAELLSQALSGSFYLGPIPGGFWFEGGLVTIVKQAYSFHMNVGQLSFDKWNMSHFPPTRTGFRGSVFRGGFETKDCSGYGQTTFPLSGPQIIGI